MTRWGLPPAAGKAGGTPNPLAGEGAMRHLLVARNCAEAPLVEGGGKLEGERDRMQEGESKAGEKKEQKEKGGDGE